MDFIFRLDVNYGGSSGYGRKYRERLRNRWGVVDTDDCITSVQELSTRYKLIDPTRVCIRGGSAGGFTTYSALSYGRYEGVFAAGTSIYGGVADLKSLATGTHKFELYYTDKFVGGSLDQVPWIYQQRSPLTYAENIKVPLMVRFPRVVTMRHWYTKGDGRSCMEIVIQWSRSNKHGRCISALESPLTSKYTRGKVITLVKRTTSRTHFEERGTAMNVL